MKTLTKGTIFVIIVGLIVLGLGTWRIQAYEIIGTTKLYEQATNRVFVFEKEQDRIAYHFSAFFLGSRLEQAEKVGQSTYMAQSRPIAGLIDAKSDGEFQYTPNNKVVEVDGLRHQMKQGISYNLQLQADKRYTIVLKQKIEKTDYQLANGKRLSVLSSKENESYIELVEVTEANLKETDEE